MKLIEYKDGQFGIIKYDWIYFRKEYYDFEFDEFSPSNYINSKTNRTSAENKLIYLENLDKKYKEKKRAESIELKYKVVGKISYVKTVFNITKLTTYWFCRQLPLFIWLIPTITFSLLLLIDFQSSFSIDLWLALSTTLLFLGVLDWFQGYVIIEDGYALVLLWRKLSSLLAKVIVRNEEEQPRILPEVTTNFEELPSYKSGGWKDESIDILISNKSYSEVYQESSGSSVF